MKVKIHQLFKYLLKTTAVPPEAVLGFSLAASPRLGHFLADLDPNLSLDWSNQAFEGLPALREHVLARSGLSDVCSIEDVLITAGTAEANFLAIIQLVQPGDEIIVEQPGWPQPVVLGKAIGAEIKVLPRREEADWHFDLDELTALISPRTRLIFLSNPNNPTGQIMRQPLLNEVINLADKAGAYLLCDEVYAGLEWQGARVPAVAGLYQRGISTGSVSKTLGLQGLRTGWLISPDPQVIFEAMVLRENSSEIMNVLGEAIAEIALRPERYQAGIAAARDDGRRNLELLQRFIDGRAELSWVRPAAGLIGLGRLHLPVDAETLATALLQPPYRTFLIPGNAYGFPQHIRLGVGGGEEAQLEEGLARLGALLDDHSRSSILVDRT